MASRTTVTLVDDLDGTEAEQSVLFGFEGVDYEIDLSSVHAQALRDALSQLRVRGTLHTGAGVTSAAFSPDGKHVATASGDGTTRIWSVDSHKQVAVLSIPAGVSTDNLAFSPDGRLIVTAQDDGSARIWSAGSHRQLAALRPRARGFMLGVAQLLASNAIDGPVAGSGCQPAAGVGWDTVGRPPFQSDDECLARRVFGDVEITEPAGERGDDAAVLLAVDRLDGRSPFGLLPVATLPSKTHAGGSA